MLKIATTGILKALLNQYKSPTGLNKFKRGITPIKADQRGPKWKLIRIMSIKIHPKKFKSLFHKAAQKQETKRATYREPEYNVTPFDGLVRASILFFRSAKKRKLGSRRRDLPSCQVLLNSVQWFQRRIRKCFSQSEARVAIFFRIGMKNTNLVEDFDILLPIKAL